ncbi:alpha/beta hydrolase [Sphingomonas carotinifaciens]|nr:alpha/beta hydrolase [Sphingomonas carotinifaciens]MBB4086982.1 acetyl esterase/lipase [Sphingomonas carotinifaciens]
MTGTGMSMDRATIAAMGNAIGPDVLAAVQALYGDDQARIARDLPVAAADLSYGDDPRHQIDLYRPVEEGGHVPVLLFVHGGGFVRGEKRSADHPFNAHVGRWAARHGMVGAVMNYRRAPEHGWPAGGEDVAAAIDWLRDHVAGHGGDPARIVVMGTSAGAVHVATALMLRAATLDVAAAVLLSGLYGHTPIDARDALYYGDPTGYPARMPREAVTATTLPLFLACAQYDPPRFQRETIALLAERLERHGTLTPAAILSGHNHYSLAAHLGTADTRLSDDILGFLADNDIIGRETC